MDLKQIKQDIANRTGIPADLLNGETVEENIAQAKALLAYRREHEAQRPKNTAEQFAEYISDLTGTEGTSKEAVALDEIAEQARIEAGGFPAVKDAGNPLVNGKAAPDHRPAHEQFEEWAKEKLAFRYR